MGIPACLVGHPDQIADVLIVNAQSYTKSNMLRTLLGDGLATSESELWRRQRTLLLPLFSRERLPEYGRIIARNIDRMMSNWQDGMVRDIYRDMMSLTLDTSVGRRSSPSPLVDHRPASGRPYGYRSERRSAGHILEE